MVDSAQDASAGQKLAVRTARWGPPALVRVIATALLVLAGGLAFAGIAWLMEEGGDAAGTGMLGLAVAFGLAGVTSAIAAIAVLFMGPRRGL